MAAPIKFSKFSKIERKMLKKQVKAQNLLVCHDGINMSSEYTMHLVVFNGGLGNGVSRDFFLSVFEAYGQVVSAVMEAGQPHAFITFANAHEAEAAARAVSGRQLRPAAGGAAPLIFYVSPVNKVPGVSVPSISALPPGLLVLRDVISEEYEERLLAAVDWQPHHPTHTAQLKHRQVKHYGYEFLYKTNTIDPDTPLEQPVPAVCDEFLEHLERLGYLACRPDQLTVNRYAPGQGIPAHIDTHSACTDTIMSLSLGAGIVMDFRHPDGRVLSVWLPRRSAAILSGEARYVWTHAIHPRKSDLVLQSVVTGDTSEEGGEGNTLEELSSTLGRLDIPPAGCDSTLEGHDLPRDKCDGILEGLDACDITSNGSGVSSSQVTSDGLTLIPRGERTSFTFRRVLRGPCCCRYPAHCDSRTTSSRDAVTSSGRDAVTLGHDAADVAMPSSESEAEKLERQHVHKVYEEIAGHFSATRHTAWPRVATFLQSLPDGALVCDLGCGNGKYLAVNPRVHTVGFERSASLCAICAGRGHACVTADVLRLPLRHDVCDAALCVAVIHHLATPCRRRAAVREMARVLRPGGRGLVTVWAFEQERGQEKSNYLKSSKTPGESPREATLASCNGQHACDDTSMSVCPIVSDRADKDANSSTITNCPRDVDHGTEPSFLKVHVNRTDFESQDVLVPWHLRGKPGGKVTRLGDKASEPGDKGTKPGDKVTKPIDQMTELVTEPCDKATEPDDNVMKPGDNMTEPGDNATELRDKVTKRGDKVTELGDKATKPGDKVSELGDVVTKLSDNMIEHGDKMIEPLPGGGRAPVFHRFYHVFREGELELLCGEVENITVFDTFYDKGNWCVIFEKIC